MFEPTLFPDIKPQDRPYPFPSNPEPYKPTFTVQENLIETTRRVNETLDRVLRMEEHIRKTLESYTSTITADNVAFKNLMTTTHNQFAGEVTNEINSFEADLTNAYSTLSTDCKNQINALTSKYTEEMNAFKEELNGTYDNFRDAVESRLEQHNEAYINSFNDYVTQMNLKLSEMERSFNESYSTFVQQTTEEITAFKTTWVAEIDARLDGQDSKINDAYLYFKTNFQATVDNAVAKLIDEGVINADLMEQIAGTKVDKGGLEQITMAMLAQEVKTAMTGGSVAVVGEGAVNTSNIVNTSVTQEKLALSTLAVSMYAGNPNAYTVPLILIDTVNNTYELNPDFTFGFNLVTNKKIYKVEISTLGIVPCATANDTYKLFYSPTENAIHVVLPYDAESDTYKDMLFLGGVYEPYVNSNNIVPVNVNGAVILPNSINGFRLPANSWNMQFHKGEPVSPNGAVFDFNFENNTCTILATRGYNLNCAMGIYAIPFPNVNVEIVPSDRGHYGVWYNVTTNTLIFCALSNSQKDNYDDAFYLGVICSKESLGNSHCILPHTIDGTYYVYNGKYGRKNASLIINGNTVGGNVLNPYIDVVNKCLVIPKFSSLYAVTETGFYQITAYDTNEAIVIPLVDGLRSHLVGYEGGLQFLTDSEWNSIVGRFSKTGVLCFGYYDSVQNKCHFNFDCEIAKSISFLGDSITTFAGYIPDGNAVYYNGSNCGVSNVDETWWKRVVNEMGYVLNTNNAWSGSKVTGAEGLASTAVTRAELLDNGTDPDIIVVYIGINDFNASVDLGEYTGKGVLPNDLTTFRNAYAVMLSKILRKYTKSKVYVMTLPTCQRTADDVVSPESNSGGVYLSEYNEGIREIAHAYGVSIIEGESCGITLYNAQHFFGDYDTSTGKFLHPNADGHKLIAEKVIQALK